MSDALETALTWLAIATGLVGYGGVVCFIGALLSTNHLEDD